MTRYIRYINRLRRIRYSRYGILPQAALEMIDDPRGFRAMVCDFSVLCRALAPPPREALQTTYFII